MAPSLYVYVFASTHWNEVVLARHGLSARYAQSRCGPTLHSADEGSDHTAMASAALAALSPLPPILVIPGTPAIPWPCWIHLFRNFLLASGATDLPMPHHRALLLHCLGPEGQRIFDALPPQPTAPHLPTTADVDYGRYLNRCRTVAGSPSKMPPREVFLTSTRRGPQDAGTTHITLGNYGMLMFVLASAPGADESCHGACSELARGGDA
ncbi:hypothetical protein HPB50_013561 [Hyalomma asiaticum]|uniref:Uncharacterized protein n=1 Tax=Hyalomma asiaticum TaxID=266040 RepID=A0ACB7S5I5_HYAAI|nr:hypothetical protein HPB50_013561 [Hyalomma asiaticum]